MADGDMLTAADAAQRMGMKYKTFMAACRAGKIPDAVRNPDWPKSEPCWWVPEALTQDVQRDSSGRIIWKPAPERIKPGVKPGYQRDGRPRCESCGIVLEESGDLLHPPDPPDARVCWMCEETYG